MAFTSLLERLHQDKVGPVSVPLRFLAEAAYVTACVFVTGHLLYWSGGLYLRSQHYVKLTLSDLGRLVLVARAI